MARAFKLPKVLTDAGWSVKIRNRERVEPPHVTVMFRTKRWRYGLRDGAFLDGTPPPREVPPALRDQLATRRAEFTVVWDQLYPENPVDSQDGGDGNA